jgi:recombinational DNA repair protein (RecF pathway)
MLERTVTPNCAKCRKPTNYTVTTPYAELFWCEECQEPEAEAPDTHNVYPSWFVDYLDDYQQPRRERIYR